MVDTDKQNFGTQLLHFGTVHSVTVTAALRAAYWEDLKGMSRADFDRACTELRRSSQWFPKPATFFSAANRGWM